MTDRDLLGLAAKAAGMKPPQGQGGYINRDGGFCYYLDCEGKTSRIWNPLKDDGDALRLAVKLRMRVNISGAIVLVVYYTAVGAEGLEEQCGQDATSATRLAIVRAAAAIGAAMS